MSRKSPVKVGYRGTNNAGQDFTVVECTGRRGRDTYFLVAFDGFEDKLQEYRLNSIREGSIKNAYYPIVFGVGCRGELRVKSDDPEHKFFKDMYIRWHAMLDRCYNPNHNLYKSYGAKGVYVSDEWLNFSNYYVWIRGELSKVFNLYQQLEIDFMVDKDLRIPGNKVYSSETCCVLPSEINRFIAHKRYNADTGLVGIMKFKNYAAKPYAFNKNTGTNKIYFYATLEEAKRAFDNHFYDRLNFLMFKYRYVLTSEEVRLLNNFVVEDYATCDEDEECNE